ncbi:MAG: tRNA uridine(34) 5-carboxymethylaminomethyl modification radical SAM/GNAT enzyme Elp3, partial [Candidatus ainarchaeum sp.]|nr:tRNA uridine(34) 5-carboxymethylaminomethyl modification radical SAM/GNAT enzyme Elp3 [Candidatus ainarchaeum sp.]
RVELGVQNPNDKIYKLINRGHSVKEVIEATKIAKDAGLKVVYHLMPGLLGSNKKRDIDMVKKIFKNENFKPDMLKIYPTLVIEGTELFNMMKKGKYRPLENEEAVEIISEWYRYIPKYVRVMRIQRDIPSGLIDKGVKKSNLRELVEKRINEKNIKSMEIRSREIGLNKGKIVEPKINYLEYKASKGTEIFLSIESGKDLIGFIRLRIPYKSCRKEINNKTAIIRELHVYGEEAEIDKKGKIQHKGFGKILLKEAEKIAKNKFKMKKILVISGVGVREYYRKFGYKNDGPYLSKTLI